MNKGETKKMLTGNQAIARGFYEACGHLASSYPGSPTVEIMETLKQEYMESGIYAEFSINEKVALEVAVGGSIAGARSMVSMKHVGVNVAMDPLMTFTQTKINGGFLLVTGDDPGMASSQNEQDNRLLAKFAHMAVLDPSDSQEAKDFTKLAFELSEQFDLPMMMRITSRLCHSRSVVKFDGRTDVAIKPFVISVADYGMIPPNTFAKQYSMHERIEKIATYAEMAEINKLIEEAPDTNTLIITSGLVYENLLELEQPFNILKLGMVYPLPIERIRALSERYPRIIVIEEMMPFIENELRIHGIPCEGKSLFSFTGELHTEILEAGLVAAGILTTPAFQATGVNDTVNRPPMFCSGCPHRPVFDILKKSKKTVIGDIGCYSLAVLEPLEVLTSIISMGACLGIMKGMSKAMTMGGTAEPLVAVIGDGTFFHSGMTGTLNLMHQLDKDANLTLIILNNGTTAMTGGQMTAVSGNYTSDGDMKVDLESLLKSMGFERIKVVDQFKYKEAKKVLDEEMNHPGLSIVITTRPCALNYKIQEPVYAVDPTICIGCRSCVKTNCPPIAMKQYEGIEKLKSSINPDLCVGCSVCSQVCPVNAIKLKGVK